MPGTRQTYYPFGQIRTPGTNLLTDKGFTGQRLDDTGLMHYGARFYSPLIGRFVSADTIVPNGKTRLTPLTVDFHEFIAQVGEENRLVEKYGPFFKWNEKVRKDHPVPMGPGNPQALNRYIYVYNNPLRNIDPNGHDGIDILEFQLTFGNSDAWSAFVGILQAEHIQPLAFKATILGGAMGIVSTGASFATGGAPLVVGGMSALTAGVTCAAGTCDNYQLTSALDILGRDAYAFFADHKSFTVSIRITHIKIADKEGLSVEIYTGGEQYTGEDPRIIVIPCFANQCAGAQFTDALSKFIARAKPGWWTDGTVKINSVHFQSNEWR